jgi:sugar transferase (PEP-CTERM system associated)
MARIFRHHVSPVKLTLAIMDFAVIAASAFAAEALRYWWLGFEVHQSFVEVIVKLVVPIVTLPIMLGVGVYQSEAIKDLKVFFIRMCTGLIATFFILSAIAYLFPVLPLWRSILVMTLGVSAFSTLLVHWLFVIGAKENFLARKVILLGAGKASFELKSKAEKTPESGLHIVSTIALPGQKTSEPEAVYFSDVGGLSAYAHGLECDLIVVGESSSDIKLPVDELVACKLSGIEVIDRFTFFEEVSGYVDLDSVKSDWIVFAEGFKGANLIERMLKRSLDLFVSLVLLLLASPILLIAMVAVKLTSRGPIFYRQERVGQSGKTFDMLKLRTMRIDAEKDGAPQFAKEKDPRITQVGTFLRRTRIDEIPQVLNVLNGDMSFVGPRPERPYFVSQLEAEVPFYRDRHCLKPGITGWAQIRYPYGASFEDSRRKLEYDLYYIKNYSLFLDLLIILQTVRVILFPQGVR